MALHWGTLVTSTAKASGEYSGGCRLAMQELGWRNYETADGTFSSSYASSQVTTRNTFAALGYKVTLGLGMHYAPTWLNSVANSKFIDQLGNSSADNNFVFNQLMRDRAEAYITRANADLGFSNYWAIRLTAGGHPEVLYPTGGNYWAYDVNAQGRGTALPNTVAPCPYPGWRPGETTITTAQVRVWAEWYIKSLADVINWQIRLIRGLGFTGWFEVVTPGSGRRPSGHAADIAARLPSNVGGRGAVWHKLYESLTDRRGVVCHCSSVMERSGNPVNNQTTEADASVPIMDKAADSWSSARWLARLGAEYGMPNSGENPGAGRPASAYYTDTTDAGMMGSSVGQAVAAKYLAFYWAHSDQLWDDTLPFSNYSTRIGAANSGSFPTPPNPP